jgi:hypothetical protein
MSISARQLQYGFARSIARVVCVTLVSLVALAGCGSSKPAYCSARTNLENSIKGLTGLNLSGGISGLEAQLKKIQTDANELVSKAKGDFPSETSAIKSSVDALTTTVGSISGTPSASEIATVASNASNVATSIKNFMDTTSSKC